jgi:MSHA biogenesis protein MshO
MTRLRTAGVTLVELVIVIVLIGILASIATVVLVPAYEAYFASQRRAELSDAADTAIRRMVRDVRLALPNSARVDGTGQFLEILLTRTGGRYRAMSDNDPVGTAEDALEFSSADTVFDVFEPFSPAQVNAAEVDGGPQAGDYVVIHNLGIPGANAYDFTAAMPNIKRITGFIRSGDAVPPIANEDRFTLAATATPFPLESPGRRFFVVRGPVTYACRSAGLDGAGNGTGVLLRWDRYAYEPGQPGAIANAGAPPVAQFPPLPGSPTGAAVVANNVSACAFSYTSNFAQVSRGLVRIRLTLTRANESVTLYHEVHVNNVP